MLESLPVTLLVGTVLGFLSGLGIGGGSLLILWLTIVRELEQATARLINLLFFVPSAFIACLFRLKQGKLKIKSVIPAITAGCIAAGFFSWFSYRLDVELLQKLFGFILLAAGARELFYKSGE